MLIAPVVDEKNDMAVLYSDEDGTVRWIFPDKKYQEGDSRYFYLPRDGSTPENEDQTGEVTRGIGSFIGRRILRVLSLAGRKTNWRNCTIYCLNCRTRQIQIDGIGC